MDNATQGLEIGSKSIQYCVKTSYLATWLLLQQTIQWRNKLKIGTKLFSIVALMSLLVVVVWGVGFYAAKINHESLATVYNDRVVSLEQLKIISDMYAVNIVDTTHKTRDGAIITSAIK